MRIPTTVAAASLLLALAARADDTKPPQIAEVKAGTKGSQVVIEARITDETGVLSAICHHRTAGGRVEDSPMVKNEYDDVFRVSFAGGPETEYWIEASDLLGNGPAMYGSAGKPFTAGSAKAVASAPPPRKKERTREKKAPAVARRSEPPAIQHSAPRTAPPEG